jgi:hypothetical protein
VHATTLRFGSKLTRSALPLQNEYIFVAAEAGLLLILFGARHHNAVRNYSTPSPQLVLQALRFFFHS